VQRGDTLLVDLPEHSINRRLRATKVVRRFGTAGRETEVVLTNRIGDEDIGQQTAESVQRFDRGFRGFIDRDTFRVVERQPVDSGLAATGEVPFPDDVEREIKSEITVRSIPYRSLVGSAGHSHQFSVGTTTSQNDVLDITDSQQVRKTIVGQGGILPANDVVGATVSVPNSFEGYPVVVLVEVIGAAPSDPDAPVVGDDIAISFSSSSLFTPGIESSEQHTFTDSDASFGDNLDVRAYRTPTDVTPGQLLEVEIRNLESKDIEVVNARFDIINIRHTHEVSFGATTSQSAAGFEPGLVEQFPNDSRSNGNDEILASGVDVAVNGTVEASNINSGEFITTVDIGGALSPGTNDIEIRSDSLGFISAFIETELFRRGRST
jgi:hypothetical protein